MSHAPTPTLSGAGAAGGRAGRLGLLTSLYFSQGLPFGFFVQALPVLMRHQGASLPEIGLSYLLVLPWALKFLWASFLDERPLRLGRLGLSGKRRSWIVPLQLVSAVALLGAAAVDPAAHMPLVLAFVLLTNLLAATQDVATDGLAVELLPHEERGLANGVQVAGYRVGMIVGGGALLVVYERIGWSTSFALMAGMLALATLPIVLYGERTHVAPAESPTSWREAIAGFMRRPGVAVWLIILVAYKGGDAFAGGMLRPFLVDVGKSVGTIGWMMGGVGFGAGLVGALLGGFLSERIGRVRALLLCGGLQVSAVALFVVLALAPDLSDETVAAIVGLEHLTGGMATAALFTMMMDAARPGSAGTDYTLQASVVVLATGAAGALAGPSAEILGHAGHFALGAVLALLGLALVWALISRAKPLTGRAPTSERSQP